MKTSLTVITSRPQMLYRRLLVASDVGRVSLLVTALAISGCATGTITVSPPKESSNVLSPFAVEIRWTGNVDDLDSIWLDGTDVRPQFVFDYGNKIAKATLNANVGPHKIEASRQLRSIGTYTKIYTGAHIVGLVTFTVNTCPSDHQNCSGVCLNLQTDSLNCRSCNNACGSGQICVQGNCQCPTGQRLCSGKCVNPCNPNSHGYRCGICTSCNGKPFGSNNGDDCQPKAGKDCPTGYTETHGKCVHCGSGDSPSSSNPECP
jgi:hypothetical protein